MPKAEAVVILSEIGSLESEAAKKQQLWNLRSDSRFSQVAVAYDGNDEVRFVTAFVRPEVAEQRVRFSEIGDLGSSKAEITPPHHRYTWVVEASGGRPAYVVDAYGDNPEFLTQYSIANKIQSAKIKEYPQ